MEEIKIFFKKNWFSIILIGIGIFIAIYFGDLIIGIIFTGSGISINPLSKILKKDKKKIKELKKEKNIIDDKIMKKEKEFENIKNDVASMDINDLINHGNSSRSNME